MSRRETEQKIDWNRRSNVSPTSFKISTFRSIIYIAERYRPLKSILSAFYRKRKSGIMCGHAIWNRITFTVKSFTTIPPFGERRSLTLLFLLNRRDENLYRFETTMYIYMSCFVIYLNIRGKNIRRTNDQTKMIFTRYKHERIYFIVSIDAISFRYACMVTKLLSIEIQVT